MMRIVPLNISKSKGSFSIKFEWGFTCDDNDRYRRDAIYKLTETKGVVVTDKFVRGI